MSNLEKKKQLLNKFGFQAPTYKSSQNLIASIENLYLSFSLDLYQDLTVRDLFIRKLSSPFSVSDNQGELQILSNISFNIYENDIIAILGVNGCGKTTLCRSISGILTPNQAKLNVPTDVKAIFSTSIGIQPMLTGRENLFLLAHLLYPGLNKKEIHDVVEESIEFSEIGNFIDVPFMKYSKGMQTRVCLSLISALPSQLLILDEVFDGADQYFKEKVTHRVTEMIHKSGAALFVTHSIQQVRQVCNRVIVLNNSHVEFDGNVEAGIQYYLDNIVPSI